MINFNQENEGSEATMPAAILLSGGTGRSGKSNSRIRVLDDMGCASIVKTAEME